MYTTFKRLRLIVDDSEYIEQLFTNKYFKISVVFCNALTITDRIYAGHGQSRLLHDILSARARVFYRAESCCSMF